MSDSTHVRIRGPDKDRLERVGPDYLSNPQRIAYLLDQWEGGDGGE